MSLRIVWARRAEKDRDGVDRADRARVLDSIERYADTGAGDVKRLQGSEEEHRLRVGDYRVRFAVDPTSGTLTILRVLHRREAYR